MDNETVIETSTLSQSLNKNNENFNVTSSTTTLPLMNITNNENLNASMVTKVSSSTLPPQNIKNDESSNVSMVTKMSSSKLPPQSIRNYESFNVSMATKMSSSTLPPQNDTNYENLNISMVTTTLQPQNMTNHQNDLIFGRFNIWVLIIFTIFYGLLFIALVIICRVDLKVRNTTVACRKKNSKYDGDFSKSSLSSHPPSLTPPKFHDENDIKEGE